MDSLKLFFMNPNSIWALVALAGIAYAGFKAYLRHLERLERIRQGQDPDKAA